MSNPPIPQYQRIKQALLDEINQGAYRPGRPFITEREICRRFGVSRPTAVRALSELTLQGTLIRQRGRGTFVAEPTTSTPLRPSGGAARLVGCIMAHLQGGEYPATILHGIERVCHEANCRLLLFNSRCQPRTEAINIQRAREAGVEALIVYPVNGYANSLHFEALRRDRLPLVMIDRFYPALPTDAVVVDDFAIGQRITGHVIEQGHRHIAFIPDDEVAVTSVQDRFSGYRQALREHGLPLRPELAPLRPYGIDSQESNRALLASWLAAPDRPTAYVGATSGSLIRLAHDLLSLGVPVPGDAAFAAMDDISLDPLMALVVAKAIMPAHEMGSTAMRIVLDRLSGAAPAALQHIVLPIDIDISTAANNHLGTIAI